VDGEGGGGGGGGEAFSTTSTTGIEGVEEGGSRVEFTDEKDEVSSKGVGVEYKAVVKGGVFSEVEVEVKTDEFVDSKSVSSSSSS